MTPARPSPILAAAVALVVVYRAVGAKHKVAALGAEALGSRAEAPFWSRLTGECCMGSRGSEAGGGMTSGAS